MGLFNYTNQLNFAIMNISNLQETPISEIVDCITDSFTNYFVPMPAEVDYWTNRFKSARVDFALSYGMFNEGKLIGFIINGVDRLNGELIAFNTGTGVASKSRGQQITDQLYAFAIPHLKEKGITRCKLEVIQKNEIAVHVYERIGFSITRTLKCFKGSFQPSDANVLTEEVPYSDVTAIARNFDHHYSWENCVNAIELSDNVYKTYKVTDDQKNEIGFFVVNPYNAYIPQLEITTNNTSDWSRLLPAIGKVSPSAKIINIPEERTDMIKALLAAGLENHIDQHEMEMAL